MIPIIVNIIIFFLILGLPLLFAVPYLSLFLFIVLVLIILFSYLSIKMTSFELRSDGLFIKRGVIAKKQILLLYAQIQDVSEYQDLVSRILGIKSLQIQTMTRMSAFAGRLKNLEKQDAEKLKAILLEAINSRSKIISFNKSAAATSISEDINTQQDESKANPYPLHFIKIGSIAIILCLVAIIIILLLFRVTAFSGEAITNIITLIIVLVAIPIGFIIKQYTFKYWLGANTVAIKSGFLSQQKTSMEYEKIQDFIIYNNIITRLLGLASVRLETGSVVMAQSGNNKQMPNYIIPALDKKHAQAIANFLIGKMGIKYTPNSVPMVNQIPLSKKKVMKKTISRNILTIIIIAILAIVLWLVLPNKGSFIRDNIAILSIALIAFNLISNYIYQKLYLKYYYYDASRDTLTIRKGVIGRSQIFLPFEKIQNVFVDQDLFDRMFGIYDVHVSTVGAASMAMCHIDGLKKENADKLRTILMQQVKQNIRK
jgi:membrane protein YdbS with pleckstrin-like domain